MSDKLPMTGKDLAYWLADKIPALGDYAKEAAEVLRKQADEIERLRCDHIECWQGRDIISSFSDAMNNLPTCGMLAIAGAAMQEIDALRSGEFICKKCGLRKDVDNFFNSVPF